MRGLVRRNIIVEEILKLKQLSGKDIAVFGSSDLAITLIQHRLIDEYRIIVNPIFLGNGKSLFKGINEKLYLKLLKTKTFSTGNVLLYYMTNKKRKERDAS